VAEEDPLAQMRTQVDAAYAAADRLVRDAEAAARERERSDDEAAGRGTGDVPPAGFEGERAHGEHSAFPDIQALAGLLESARTSLPPELAHQLAQAARELLIALRALIDWWIARLEREPEAPVEVEDIPID
jgi:hypothetical protein